MPTFNALLQDVIDNPDDDLPRMVLGDWLLDQPDTGSHARGEFLHTQVRLANLALDDPARDELEMRSLQLLPEYPQKWARPFRRAGAKAWTFGRGLVEGLSLRETDFAKVKDKLVTSQPVTRLRLSGAGWDTRLAGWSGLRNIQALKVEPRPEQLAMLRSPAFAHLRELKFAQPTPWRSILDPSSLSCLGNLKSLCVRGVNANLSLLQQTLSSQRTPRLQALSVYSASSTDLAFPRVDSLSVGFVDANLASMLTRTKASLRVLSMGGFFPASSNLEAGLFRHPSLTNLHTLEFNHTTLRDTKALSELLQQGKIVRLVFNWANIGPLRPLLRAKAFSFLRELTVARSGSADLTQYASDLEELATTSLPRLRSLTLIDYRLSMNGMLDLLAADWLQQLHALTLRSCQISPHLVASITACDWPRLGLLDLRGTCLPAQQKEALRRRFGVKVKY